MKEGKKRKSYLVWLYHQLEGRIGIDNRIDWSTIDDLIDDAIILEKHYYAENRCDNEECVEISSWEAADKINLNGYVYVRSADLKFCNHQTNP
jgi:hypothetical protein